MDHRHRRRGAGRLKVRVFVLVLMLAAAPGLGVAQAQPFEALGTRALGMGGAFVAVADDATAVYWNPAGLATGDFLSLLLDHSQAGGWDSGTLHALPAAAGAGTIAALSTNEVGFAYYRLRVDDARSLVTHNVAISGAQFAFPGVSFGTSLRYVRGVAGFTRPTLGSAVDSLARGNLPLDVLGQHAFDLDAGVLIGSDTVRVGLVARNLRQPHLETPGGGSIRLDRRIRAGLAVRTVAGLLVSADLDLTRSGPDAAGGSRRSAAAGAEQWFGRWFALRGGARVNLEAEDPRVVGAVGLSVALTSGVYLDGQLTRGRDSPERGWGVAARVGF